MDSTFLSLFILWNILVAVATAPTLLPYVPEGFDLNKEMNVFKNLLHKQFEAAKEKVEKMKQQKCTKIEDCINQKNLLKELRETLGGCNATMENIFSKSTAFPTTVSREWKARNHER